MTYLRILGGLVGAAALVGLVAWVIATYHKAGEVDGYRACSKAAATSASPLDRCDATIRARVTGARAAAACEVALGKTPVDLFGASAACGANVKILIAAKTAAEGDLVDADAQLSAARTDRDGAIARADARAVSTSTRKQANDRTIDAAPRTDDGRVHCDAECLRNLASR